MPSFKWLFRLAVVLSFAWIAYSDPQPTNAPGGAAGSPATAINAALSKLANLKTTLREEAAASIIGELRKRGIPIDSNGSSISLASLSDIAKSALAGADGQSTTNVNPSSGTNLQSLVAQVSQLDEQQVVSQLQTGFKRLVQETGSPNAELGRNTD
jgi:hypothetical protein